MSPENKHSLVCSLIMLLHMRSAPFGTKKKKKRERNVKAEQRSLNSDSNGPQCFVCTRTDNDLDAPTVLSHTIAIVSVALSH